MYRLPASQVRIVCSADNLNVMTPGSIGLKLPEVKSGGKNFIERGLEFMQAVGFVQKIVRRFGLGIR